MLCTPESFLGYITACEYYTFTPNICTHTDTRLRDALKSAKPKPGGFTCALNKDDAENLFLALTVNCALVFVKE